MWYGIHLLTVRSGEQVSNYWIKITHKYQVSCTIPFSYPLLLTNVPKKCIPPNLKCWTPWDPGQCQGHSFAQGLSNSWWQSRCIAFTSSTTLSRRISNMLRIRIGIMWCSGQRLQEGNVMEFLWRQTSGVSVVWVWVWALLLPCVTGWTQVEQTAWVPS